MAGAPSPTGQDGHGDTGRPDPTATGRLVTDEQIRAAGAAAVTGWQLSDEQIDRIATLLSPARTSPAADSSDAA